MSNTTPLKCVEVIVRELLRGGHERHDGPSRAVVLAQAPGGLSCFDHAYEAMECIGGSGVMEDSMMPRLYREGPINAISEGSGNVQCLDVLRAMQKTPQVIEAFVSEVLRARGGHAVLDQHVDALLREFAAREDFEVRARDVVDRMSTALQGALLVQHAPSAVAILPELPRAPRSAQLRRARPRHGLWRSDVAPE